ncbi:MAG: hypothetical protein JW820_18585 [Spirochaetales bacterium]|nr:hypothetical protein [Spirochaetales bacterium]
MLDEAGRYDALRPEFEAVSGQVDSLFGAIVEGKRNPLPFPEHLVIPGLLAKTRDDFRALGDLTWQGCTSASYAVARLLIDETVDLFYLTTGEPEERKDRSARFLAFVLAEMRRVSLRWEEFELRRAMEESTPPDDNDPVRRRAAMESIRELVDTANDGQFKELVERYVEEFPKVPLSWAGLGIEDRWNRAEIDSVARRNLDYPVCVFYPSASLFIHSPGCLMYLGDRASRPDAIALAKGRIRDLHFEPFRLGLLVVMDFLRRCNTLFSAGLEGSIDSLAEERRKLLDRACGLPSVGG